MSRRFAWYSPKADKNYGSVVYRHVEGYPVIATCIGISPIKSPSMWGDEVLQGVVTDYMHGQIIVNKRTPYD